MSAVPPLVWVSGGCTDRGSVRISNQDAFLDRPDLGLWAVADGMGGHSDGALASRTIAEGLAELTPPRCLGGGVRAAKGRLRAVNRALIDRAEALLDGDLIGSTVVALQAHGEHCAILWAGDSRAYRLRNGVLTRLTTDHSQVQALIDVGAISPERLEDHPWSNVLLRAVGSDPELELDRRIERLRVGDRYLLCSDGLYRELDTPALTAMLGQGPPGACARAMVMRAKELGGRDNSTAVVVDFLSPADIAA